MSHELYHHLIINEKVHLIKWGHSQKWAWIFIPFAFIKACYLIGKCKIDVILIGDGALVGLGYLLNLFFKKKWALVVHGLDLTFQNRVYQKYIKTYIEHPDLYFCNSQHTLAKLLEFNVQRDRCHVVPLGVRTNRYERNADSFLSIDTERFDLHINRDKITLLTVGRLIKRKGVIWFLENVFIDLIKLNKEIHYYIVGRGSDRMLIEEKIDAFKLNDFVTLVGEISDNELAALYSVTDIFVMPNIKVEGDAEGFGLVALEAAASGSCVVAANIEGITEAIKNGENGILLESGNSKAFINELSTLIKDKDKRERFGLKSKEYTLREFSWKQTAQKYRDKLSQLMNTA